MKIYDYAFRVFMLNLITVGIMLGSMLSDAVGVGLFAFKCASLSFLALFMMLCVEVLIDHLYESAQLMEKQGSAGGRRVLPASKLRSGAYAVLHIVVSFLMFNAVVLMSPTLAWTAATFINIIGVIVYTVVTRGNKNGN